ncbi:zincin [Saccharata proteae CBS 121410]|uniref:Disintegrin and metalloproteinase domain-containing protein B n=1 Tax=Saccharata proteae CBS 121410 TaxID=1314787 RepID=A0A9P4I203_9PEZI|nr:zincin [Saccharata proteae CBS 121410]
MRLHRAAALAAALVVGVVVPTVVAGSVARNRLAGLETTSEATSGTRIRLSLEPNHDIIADGAMVRYLGPDGEVVRTEAIDRLEHKVYKGWTWVKSASGEWVRRGTARITVRRDGIHPLFEGVVSVDHNNHHIQMSSSYMQTKHRDDPELELEDDEFMVVWRDSDISPDAGAARTELRRSLEADDLLCGSDSMDFNMRPDHPVYGKMLKREDGFWGTPIDSLLFRRQIDSTPGSGNSGGVNLVSTIGQTSGCPSARKVALVGVATDCTYTASFNSTESARQNVITQMNSASNLYENSFNITLGLQNLTVSDSTCPGSEQTATPWNQACSNSITIQDRLNLFSAWRGTQEDNNSHWTLLSTCNTGSAVGLAWLGQACVQEAQTTNSSGTSETVSGANVVVKTSTEWQVIAHETGHTFGAVHDCTSQTCSDGTTVNAQQCCPLSSSTCDAGEQYIMNPSTSQGISHFSLCSIGNICSAMGRNSVKTSCLTNNKDVTTISGQQCGNGIVEDGEDCDCGGTEGCGDNACCDASTCKFKNNAVCDDANEDCCRDCQLATNATVCRASTGDCDPEEVCTGSSPYCPADKTAPDGQGCGSGGLKCASGQCTSRDLQCRTLMGSYTNGSNDTYACDDQTCQISCASPEFGTGVCYGLQQNFLDGTACGGGGKCANGVCKGSSVTKEVGSWIQHHKALVIGIASAVGALLLLAIAGCCLRACRKPKTKRQPLKQAWPPGAPPPPYGMEMGTRGGAGAGWYPPPPPPPHGMQGVPPPPPPGYGGGRGVRYA